MRTRIVITLFLFGALLGGSGLFSTAVFAHPHHVTNGNGEEQVIANGQNHPGFVVIDGQNVSCEGVNEPANAGPAGYGLETAHHGPDQGQPGKGAFASSIPLPDNNPAID